MYGTIGQHFIVLAQVEVWQREGEGRGMYP